MKILAKYLLSSLLICTAFLSIPAIASVEWALKRELNLEAAPLDMSTSPDGKLVYVLVSGRILIYSVVENRIIDSMLVDKSADKLISGRDNSFIVLSSVEKKLKIYQMETREKIDTSGRPFKGPKDAPVTIAVFSDYQCPYCGRLDTLLKQVLEKNPRIVKIVFKNFPLKFHAFAKNAAIAALAANDQGKFYEFHEKLFASISTLNDAKIQEIAKEINLDMERFNRKLQDSSLQEIIKRDLAEGERIGVNSTPTIYINGKLLNDRSLQGFQDVINMELKEPMRNQ